MATVTNNRIPAGLRGRLEGFFERSLEGLPLVVGREVESLAAESFTDGRAVFVGRDFPGSPGDRQLRMLAHEVTHVLQQESGRVRPSGSVAGHALNDDAGLEFQADWNAGAILGGQPAWKPASRGAGRPGIIQRLVTVEGQQASSASEFSFKFQKILSLIPGGPGWLDWAISEPSETFASDSEEGLVDQVQLGLHGTSLIAVNGLDLLISPLTLMGLPDDQVAALTETGNSIDLSRANRVLGKNDFKTVSDLQAAATFLQNQGVATATCLAALSLGDQIDLLKLIDQSTSEPLNDAVIQKEAAAFAVRYAQSTEEFVQAYLFYMGVASGDKGTSTPDARSDRAVKVWGKLLPLSYSLTETLVVSPTFPAERLVDAVQDCVTKGGQIGFRTLPAAMQSFVWNSPAGSRLPSITQQAVDQYMSQAQAFLRTVDASPESQVGPLNQSGNERTLVLESTGERAELTVKYPQGTVCLTSYKPKTAETSS